MSNMAKNKKKSRRAANFKLPLTIAVPVGIPVYNAVNSVMQGGKAKDVAWFLMGYGEHGFNKKKVAEIAVPIVGGVIAHKVAAKYVNRYLPKWLPISI